MRDVKNRKARGRKLWMVCTKFGEVIPWAEGKSKRKAIIEFCKDEERWPSLEASGFSAQKVTITPGWTK